jgi:putative hemolysin
MRHILLVLLIVVALFISACGALSDATNTPAEPVSDMANPASEYCLDQGGTLEIRDETEGQVGTCIFPDGSECEEWAFFRGECAPGVQEDTGMLNPASKYCADQGGELEIRDEAEGQVGTCIFPDGSECEEWAFFRGECEPGGEEGAPGGEDGVVMPNPASQHCVDNGGKLEIRDETEGQMGTCIFPDGSECEEWAFFRGECAPGAAYQPLDPAACSDLADGVSEAAGTEVTAEKSAFEDTMTGEIGTGCQSKAAWTEENFVSTPVLAKALSEMLAARGWAEDAQYRADGPTGTAAAFRLENGLCLLQVEWEPTEDANCPADQPIAACELKPDQQLHKVDLNCAQIISSAAPVGLPNPASQFCADQGGELEIREEAEGQVGICIFPDGSECDEWAFFRGECAPGGG